MVLLFAITYVQEMCRTCPLRRLPLSLVLQAWKSVNAEDTTTLFRMYS
jgi:hypothetical protein